MPLAVNQVQDEGHEEAVVHMLESLPAHETAVQRLGQDRAMHHLAAAAELRSSVEQPQALRVEEHMSTFSVAVTGGALAIVAVVLLLFSKGRCLLHGGLLSSSGEERHSEGQPGSEQTETVPLMSVQQDETSRPLE